MNQIVELKMMKGKRSSQDDSRLAWKDVAAGNLKTEEEEEEEANGCCGSSCCNCPTCCSLFLKYVIGRSVKLCLYILDIATDLSVASIDYQNGDIAFSAITLALVFAPGFLFSLYAFTQVLYNTTGLLTWIKAPFWILIFPVLPLWPIVRDLRQIYHGFGSLCSSNRDHHLEELNKPSRAYLVKFLEAFTEAAPQILLRLYKITTKRRDMPFYGIETLEYIQISASLVSLATNLISTYQKSISTANIIKGEMEQHERFKLSILTQIFVFLWWVPFLMARFQALALFASALTWWIFLVIGIHAVLVFLFQTIAAGKDRIKRIFIYLFSGFVFIFAYLNFNMKSRIKVTAWFPYAIFTILVFLENSVMIVAWFFILQDNDSSTIDPEDREYQRMYRMYLVFFHYGAFAVSILFMILAFACSPSQPKEAQEKNKKNYERGQREPIPST